VCRLSIMSVCWRCSSGFTLPVNKGCCGLNIDMATTNVVWVDGQPYSPNHPKALAQYRKDMEHIPTPPSLGRELKDKVAKRLRQDSKPLLNKLETEFYNNIKDLHPGLPVRAQAKIYRLANGLTLRPDFTASGWPDQNDILIETAWEVKGPWVDGDAFGKLKMAASVWPEVRWILVWKEDGQWREQIILP
jgi:hypothetical protein